VLGTSDDEIAQAMRERADFGLRADEAWVRQVAANPRSRTDLIGIPLLPEEAVEFQGRQEKLLQVARTVQGYTDAHPEQVAGMFIDQEHRLVVVLVTAALETHRAAIDALLPDGGPVDVRLATHTRAELEALMNRVVEDRAFLKAIQAAFIGAGLDEIHNRVDLEISSANPAAAAIILDHFGVGPELLNVTSDGTGIALLPAGKVRGRVTEADGTRPADPGSLSLSWTSDSPGPGSGDCGGGDIGYGVGADGRFELPCQPGGWTISITDDSRPDRKEVGRTHVVVPPGLAVDVVIRLAP
jgi:hypothetical protein